MLDTNVLVDFQSGDSAVCKRVLSHPIDDLATTVITVEEQLSGWYTLLRRAKDHEQLARAYQRLADSVLMLSRFRLLSFTENAIERFEHLRTLQLGVKHMDLRVAAISLKHGGTPATRNVTDFTGVPGLIVEN